MQDKEPAHNKMQAQEGIENIKLDMMIPTAAGLGNNKETSRDLNAMIGLFNPAKFGKKEYLDYNIKRLKNCVRFLNVIEDRDYGAAGFICPLFFDGATSTFKELPPASETAQLEKFYRYAEYLNAKNTQKKSS